LPSSGERRIVIAIDLDYFYAQCEEVRDPTIKGKPVVICVFSGRTNESGAVSTANYLARSLGARSGMPIVQAKKILQKNPESVFLPTDIEYYSTVSDRIMEIIRSFSEKFEQSSIDEAYIDVSTLTSAGAEDAASIGKRIKTEIFRAENLTCSIGIGPNKLMAKMAVDSRKPDGLTVISLDQVKTFLDPLPVGKLFGIGPRTEEKLRAIGITTIRELGSSDPNLLSEKFGIRIGGALYETANGIDDDPVAEKEPEQMSRIITLKHDVEAFDFQELLKPLADDISNRLSASGYLAKSVGIILITSNLKMMSRLRTISAPTNSGIEILKNAVEMFESFYNREESEEQRPRLRRVGIRVSGLARKPTAKSESLSDYF